jgi:hypothetical protein
MRWAEALQGIRQMRFEGLLEPDERGELKLTGSRGVLVIFKPEQFEHVVPYLMVNRAGSVYWCTR